ncbi:dioxygenase, partial [Labrys neptuniae]|uniref:VOC family protein n=1 Tax=Labrys neptuniae TaxID=376174 RepID=UPI00288DA10F|nr:dioxygenase [Labrys neptuniae]
KVGDHLVPMPHLGVILPLDACLALAARLEQAGIAFEIPPVIRFEGEPGEQRTMFFRDPSGNPIEIKGFKDFDGVFAR